MSTSAWRSGRAACRPPKPPPTMTTCGRRVAVMMVRGARKRDGEGARPCNAWTGRKIPSETDGPVTGYVTGERATRVTRWLRDVRPNSNAPMHTGDSDQRTAKIGARRHYTD